MPGKPAVALGRGSGVWSRCLGRGWRGVAHALTVGSGGDCGTGPGWQRLRAATHCAWVTTATVQAVERCILGAPRAFGRGSRILSCSPRAPPFRSLGPEFAALAQVPKAAWEDLAELEV